MLDRRKVSSVMKPRTCDLSLGNNPGKFSAPTERQTF